jgi:hypothetical protein
MKKYLLTTQKHCHIESRYKEMCGREGAGNEQKWNRNKLTRGGREDEACPVQRSCFHNTGQRNCLLQI